MFACGVCSGVVTRANYTQKLLELVGKDGHEACSYSPPIQVEDKGEGGAEHDGMEGGGAKEDVVHIETK